MEKKKETLRKSIFKSLSWRVIATLTTISIAYIVTGNVENALQIGFGEVLVKSIVYYIHERAWAKFP